MNPANRLGGVVAVTVVTLLSMAGVVFGAAFIVDNTRSDDQAGMETVEAMVGMDNEPGESGWGEFSTYDDYSSEENLPDFEFVFREYEDEDESTFGFRSPRLYSEDWVEIDPDYRFRIYPDEDDYRFFNGDDDWLGEEWSEFDPPEFRFRGYVVPSDEFDGRERWFGDYRGTTDELMDGLFEDGQNFGLDELGPEFEEQFREMFDHLIEKFVTDEFYLYMDDEYDDE